MDLSVHQFNYCIDPEIFVLIIKQNEQLRLKLILNSLQGNTIHFFH